MARLSDDELVERAAALVARGGRILGITGAPGAGKSTLAETLVHAFGARARLLPMDGFHLADEELARLGRGGRKGAPDTFDVDGYVAALERTRSRAHDVLVPRFRRELELAEAGSIRVSVDVELVITEGNYLLLDRPGWRDVRPLLDECWLVRPDDDLRRRRLVDRHVAHGRSREAAEAWVRDVDEANARLVATASTEPDLVIER